jgi:hypothetical protein
MKVSDLEVIRGEKREPCLYCGGPEHAVPLACPRIAYVVADEQGILVEIHFWPPDDEPQPAA